MKRQIILLALTLFLYQECQVDAALSKCQVFAKYGILTYENNLYEFESSGGYTLSKFTSENNEDVFVKLRNSIVCITIGAKEYALKKEKGAPVFVGVDKSYSLPAVENDVEVSKPGTYVTADFGDTGLLIKWDVENFVSIEIDDQKNTALSGLCSYAEKNNIDNWCIDGQCVSKQTPHCPSNQAALIACRAHLNMNIFRPCLTNNKISDEFKLNFINSCVKRHCQCKLKNKNDCVCGLIEALGKTCMTIVNKPLEWRTTNLCHKKCPGALTYKDCGQKQKSCGAKENNANEKKSCVEGCACPLNLYTYKTECKPVTECPCHYDGKDYGPGESITQDCRQCTCLHNNQWQCVGPECKIPADAQGDPHFTTFDGVRYDFMGKCTYYLVKGIDFSVKGDFFRWNGHQYVKCPTCGGPTWTGAVYVEQGDHIISLKPGPKVYFNDVQITNFPYVRDNIILSKLHAHKVVVELPNGLEVHWDGSHWVRVLAPTKLRGRIGGLFGNFNKLKTDEYMMPDGTIANDPNTFGHSWIVEGSCLEPNTDVVPHPCLSNHVHKAIAEKACAPLKTSLFTGCKDYDAAVTHESCIYDCCLTAGKHGNKCSCDLLADQANRCSVKQWRKQVPQCEVQCPKGQVYNYCINPCESSCDYLNLNKECRKSCIEGCGCPEGQTFNEEYECVPIAKCKCKYGNQYFPAGFKFTKEANTLMTCVKGQWEKSTIPNKDVGNYVPITDLYAKCKKKQNSNYSACKLKEPISCKNMHDYKKKSSQDCTEGCDCNEGYVFDLETDSCIKPEECACFYNGRSYENGVMRRDITQKCLCKNKKWECSPYDNNIEKCSVFGDTHIRNLDGKLFSYKSTCPYVLAKATLEDGLSFEITIKNGDISVKTTEGTGNTKEVTLKKDGSNFEELGFIKDFGSSKVVTFEKIGLKFIRNHEGSINIIFHEKWNNKIKGFCEHRSNPNKPITNEDVKNMAFDHYVDLICSDLTLFDPSNDLFEEDNTPIMTKCELLKSDIFKPCNDELSIDEHYKNCLVIAKNFLQENDQQGVEQYYCELFSSFAQECNNVESPVNWRSKDVCPFECQEKGTRYSPCVSGCTCNDINKSEEKKCKDGLCVEGCVTAVCMKENVYTDETLSKCVDIEECAQIKCLDELKNHPDNCNCVKGKVSCMTTTTTTSTTTSTTTTTTTSTTTKPSTIRPVTANQKSLRTIYTTVTQLLQKIKKPTIFIELSEKDKQIVDAFTKHIEILNNEILCYNNLSDRSKCICQNEQQEVCYSNDNKDHTEENDLKIANKLDVLKLVESQLKCLLSVEKGCSCVQGQKICENVPLTTKELIYSYLVNGEKHTTKYFIYLQKAKLDQTCLANLKKLPYDTCTCTNGQINCDVEGDTENNDKKSEVLSQYSEEIQKHLQCYARLESDVGHCWCEGSTKICINPDTPNIPPNEYKVIEHYLPSIINSQQIEIGFEEDLSCMKKLKKENCSCTNGKEVCPDDVTTTVRPPLSTTKPSLPDQERLSILQGKLLNSFSNVQDLILYILETNFNTKLTSNEVVTVELFRDYVNDFEAEINCLLMLSDIDTCKCQDESEICGSENGLTKHNMLKITSFLVLIGDIESQLNCLNNKVTENLNYICLGAESIYPDDTNAPSRSKITYEITVQNEKSKILLYHFINYSVKQLKCLKEIDDLTGHYKCEQGEKVIVRDNVDGLKELNERTRKSLNTYLMTIEKELLCNLQLEHEGCKCEKAKQICSEKVQIKPKNNKFEFVKNYALNPMNPNQIYRIFNDDVNCMENLENDECFCKQGKPICPDPVEPEPLPEENLLDKTLTYVDTVLFRVICFTNKKSECNTPDFNISIPAKDKLQLRIYGSYIEFIKAQLICISNKEESCKCVIAKQICPGNTSEEENKTEIRGYYEFLEHVDAQISCLLKVKRESSGCYCVHGNEICDSKKPFILYPIFDPKVLSERNTMRLYTHIELQLKCYNTIEDKAVPCNCRNGIKRCDPQRIINDPKTIEQRKQIETNIVEIKAIDSKLKCFQKTGRLQCLIGSSSKISTTIELPSVERKQINVYYYFLEYAKKHLQCLQKTSNQCSCKGDIVRCTGMAKGAALRGLQLEREEQMKLITFFVLYMKSQFECLGNIGEDIKKCICIDGKRVCQQGITSTNVLYPIIEFEDNIRSGTYEYYVYIENQLFCLNSNKDKHEYCVCSNGKATCNKPKVIVDRYTELKQRMPNELSTICNIFMKFDCFLSQTNSSYQCDYSSTGLTASTISEKKLTLNDLKLITTYKKYLYFMQKQFECVKMVKENCLCVRGKERCDEESSNPDHRIVFANDLTAYIQFVIFVDKQLNCLNRPKSAGQFCVCGIEESCFATRQSGLLIQVLSLEYPSNLDWQRLFDYVDKQVRCIQRLTNYSGQCQCIDGIERCNGAKIIIMNPSNSSNVTCGVTKCPPNMQLYKTCPTCCPKCIQQFCTVMINGVRTVKQPGEEWSNSPCEKCQCSRDADGFYSNCRLTVCNPIQDPDIEYKETNDPDECCPVLTPIGCKHEGSLYTLDSVIKRDSCETVSCTRDSDGTVVKKIDRTICEQNCPEGYEYKEAVSEQCCGTCEQAACIVNGEVKHEGTTWLINGGCKQLKCRRFGDIFVVENKSIRC